MKSLLCLSMLLVIASMGALAQTPSISANAILNSASYAYVGLPNSAIAQGSIFVIFGSNMGPATLQQISAYPLPTTLGGTSIKVVSGATTVNCLMIYTSAGQVAAILPSNTPVGTGTLTLTFNNAVSAGVPIQVIANSFGIYSLNQKGNGPGIITDPNYAVYGLNTAANPGDVSIIWGTGLGPVQGNEAGGALPGDMTGVPARVFVGNTQATLTYRGRSGCCAGLDQIAFVVPSGVTGCHVPVAVQIGSVVSNFVSMPIATGGRTCSDPTGPSTPDLSGFFSKGSVSIGTISRDRSTTTSAGLPPPLGTGQPTTTTNDSGTASFFKYTATQINTSQNLFQTTTVGTCVVFFFGGSSSAVTDPVTPTGLDAGPQITVNGPKGIKQLTPSSVLGKGFYSSTLGGGSGAGAQPLYLDAGAYTITGPGGADVVAFSKGVNVPQPLTWTNQSSVDTVVRANGQLVTWDGGDPSGTVYIIGTSIKSGTNPNGSDSVGGIFTCTAPVSAKQFNIPSLVLLTLPQSTVLTPIPGFTISLSSLSVGTTSVTPITPPPSTLDIANFDFTVSSGKSVTYQ